MNSFLLLEVCSEDIIILLCYVPASLQNLCSQNVGPGTISLSPTPSPFKKLVTELAGR